MHTDWWKCDLCKILTPRITAAYNYDLLCEFCHDKMTLMVRSECDEDTAVEEARMSDDGGPPHGK
jgi:hypothetical protein